MSCNILYHGTGMYTLAAILAEDTMFEGVHWGRKGEPHGPRFSRDYEMAKSFIANCTHWGQGGVLILDGDALARDFPVVSYRDVDCTGNHWSQDEQEEVVCTPSIPNLRKYLLGFAVDPAHIDLMLDPQYVEFAQEECGWPGDWDGRETALLKHLAALKTHPLLNAHLPVGSSMPNNEGGIQPSAHDGEPDLLTMSQ